MHLSRGPKSRLCAGLFLGSLLWLLSPALAQNRVELRMAGEVQTVRLIQTREVRVGNRTFIFNRVDAPLPRLIAPIQITTDATPSESAKVELEIAPARYLGLTLTGVRQRGITELQWWSAERGRIMAYSNADFTLFPPWLSVQVGDTDYHVSFMGVLELADNATESFTREIPDAVLKLKQQATPEYWSGSVLSEEERDVLDMLHAYYAARQDELRAAAAQLRNEAEAAQRAVEAAARQPSTLVFNFWRSPTVGGRP